VIRSCELDDEVGSRYEGSSTANAEEVMVAIAAANTKFFIVASFIKLGFFSVRAIP
jgi:hypothetical protein